VLAGDRFHAGDLAGMDAVLARAGAPRLAARTAVVAVGSNGSPDVLRGKFARGGVGGVVPLVRAELRDIAVGHSAHVSLPGFVAAAPFVAVGAVTPVVVALVDGAQLRCLDTSERTYTRRRVPAPGFAGDWWIYDTDCGVLADGMRARAPGSAAARALGDQADLLVALAAGDGELAALLGGVDPRVVLPALAASDRRRTAIRQRMAQHWAIPSGLTGSPA
jgi:hypothetical protein